MTVKVRLPGIPSKDISDFFLALHHSPSSGSHKLDPSPVGLLCRRATFFSFTFDSGYCNRVPSVMTFEPIQNSSLAVSSSRLALQMLTYWREIDQ